MALALAKIAMTLPGPVLVSCSGVEELVALGVDEDEIVGLDGYFAGELLD